MHFINVDRMQVSVSVWTQTADVEDECDGFLNYDRTHKLSAAQEGAIREANLKLIGKPKRGTVKGMDHDDEL